MIKKPLVLFFLIQHFSLISYSQTKNSIYQNSIYSDPKLSDETLPRTKIKGSLFFTLGALKSNEKKESLEFSFENKLIINTTFKGSDSLLTIIESGNAMHSPLNLDLQSKKGDTLKISTILYKFALSEHLEGIVGPKIFGYHGLAGKSTAYNERIAILDGSNFSTSSGVGPGIGISTKKENGINASIKISSNSEIIEKKSTHLISQIGLTKKFFGGTITTNNNDKFNAIGLAAYIKPNTSSSISASFEQKEDDKSKPINNWILAVQKKYKNQTFGFALGTYDEKENIGYESWSEITFSNRLKLIPVLFLRENFKKNSDFGIALNTKFNY